MAGRTRPGLQECPQLPELSQALCAQLWSTSLHVLLLIPSRCGKELLGLSLVIDWRGCYERLRLQIIHMKAGFTSLAHCSEKAVHSKGGAKSMCYWKIEPSWVWTLIVRGHRGRCWAPGPLARSGRIFRGFSPEGFCPYRVGPGPCLGPCRLPRCHNFVVPNLFRCHRKTVPQ